MSVSNYYQPSGKFSPVAFIYFILICIVLLPILATAYAYLIWYIPFVYINFLITAGLGLAVGVAVGQIVIRFGKVRNYGLAFLLALIASLVTYYFQWVVWTNLVIIQTGEESQLIHLLSHPSDLFALIGVINENGTWGFKGSQAVSGTFLTIIWVIEFLVIVIMGIITSVGRSKEPFSELANQWFEEEELPAFSHIENVASFKQQAEQGAWEQLLAGLQKGFKNDSHSVFTLYACGDEYYLSVSNATAKQKKDKVEFDTEEFIQYIGIDKTVYDSLKTKA